MGEYMEAGRTSDFLNGTKKKVILGEKEILLAMAGGHYYAVSNNCPHMNGDLSAGTLEGTVITCPRHGSQFDIREGANIRWLWGTGIISAVGKVLKSPQSLKTYKVKVEGDNILIEV